MGAEFPVRKKSRLNSYDYSAPGFYFVTVCTKIRNENILCTITASLNDTHAVGAAALGGPPAAATATGNLPKVILTPFGEAVARYIRNIDGAYHGRVIVDSWVIMPDHIHLVIQIRSPGDGPPRAAAPTVALPDIVNTLKGLTTKALGYSPWQRGYYDHIIRDGEDLCRIRKYIQENLLKWELSGDRV